MWKLPSAPRTVAVGKEPRNMLMLAFALLACPAASTLAHRQCWLDQRAVYLDVELGFCSTNDGSAHGVCCTNAEDDAVLETVSAAVESLTAECGDLYKQVECAICGPHSGHLYERLDGALTMTNSFCTSFTSACAGQLDFEADYCSTRTSSEEDDFFWSYPYTAPELLEAKFENVFPDLGGDDLPDYTLAVHQSPDGEMYWLAGKEGVIKQVDADYMFLSSTVMDLSGGNFYDGNTEQGLLDFAFSPMFEVNGYFYVSYNIDDGIARNRLSKFVYSEGDPQTTRTSEEVLLQSEAKPKYFHNGGWVGFKPSDYGTRAAFHDIYWSVGDSGPQKDPYDNGQRKDTIFGSIVRVSVPSGGMGYRIPRGNYLGGLPEICAIGFRGHWRCGFDKANDDLYCGDVGYDKVESVYTVECGKNYGWVRFEGSRCTEFSEDQYGPCLDTSRSFMTPPTFEYCHYNYDSDDESEEQYTGGKDICGDRTVEGNSIIGGHVYRGKAYADLLDGAYIFADYMGSNLYYIKKQADGTWAPGTIISNGSLKVVSFTETTKGEVLVVDRLNNIYHMPCGDLCAEATSSPGATSSGIGAAYSYVGCFADDSSNRVLTGSAVFGHPSMTAEVCAEICQGSTYFGTEFSTECFCGRSTDVPGSLGRGRCHFDCSGDPTEDCGGVDAISVYEYTSP